VLLAAGCGGSPPRSHVAALGPGSTPTQGNTSPTGSAAPPAPGSEASTSQTLAYALCMRSHGVPSFPDPTTSPREFKTAFNTQSPAFHSAETDCAHLLPGGGPRNQSAAQVAALVAFARCMRSHGFPSFPDPDSSGQLTHEMLANAGINLHQPAVVPAADACAGVTHGVITKAAVARFVAGQ
jgi:hypothetical protein